MDSTGYEIFIGRMMEMLAANSLIDPPSIAHLKKLVGKSGETYEIDLSYRFRVAGADYLTLIECKYWNHPVGRDVVSAFRSVVEDIGAHKGIIVTTRGFQSGAVGLAMKCGIGLFKVSDENNYELHAVANFVGPEREVVAFLEGETEGFSGGRLREATGIINPRKHVVEFIYDTYGERAAVFVNQYCEAWGRAGEEETEKPLSLWEVSDGPWKDALIRELEAMPDDWIYEYLNAEAGGLNLIFPTSYSMMLRALNLRVDMTRVDLLNEWLVRELCVLGADTTSAGWPAVELPDGPALRDAVLLRLGERCDDFLTSRRLVADGEAGFIMRRNTVPEGIGTIGWWRGEEALRDHVARLLRDPRPFARTAVLALFLEPGGHPGPGSLTLGSLGGPGGTIEVVGASEGDGSLVRKVRYPESRHRLTIVLVRAAASDGAAQRA